jgi:hypothetical protein
MSLPVALLSLALLSAASQPSSETTTLAAFIDVAPELVRPPENAQPNILFQTNVAYDPRVDLRADQVIVHRHGSTMEGVAEGLETWQEAGHDVVRMFFVSSDAGQHFEQGRVTGEPRPDVMEMTADGSVLRIENHRAYIFPDDDWVDYVATFIDHAIAHGAVGVAPEEPFGHAQTGYEEAYKRLWERSTGTPWSPPHASPRAFWQAGRFKSAHFLDMIERLSDHSNAAALEQGVPFDFLLPIHSPLSNMAGGRIFPNVGSIGLEHVDAWIAQVWQGPVLWALGNLAGEKHDGFMESAISLYGTFAELARNTDQTMYFLVDPVEDDPQRTWATYKERYEQCVVAMLQYPWVDHYEVMPWPDRIFLPGYGMGSGTPGPSDYLTQLMAVIAALHEMPGADAQPSPNDQGFGVFLADSASWEIHGPQSPGFDSFHGLYLPFAAEGVLVRLPWLERADEPGYLDDFRVLALSYDLQKPVRPKLHQGVLEWVRAGGWLVLVGGASAYDDVDAWWNQDGFASPGAALLHAAGAQARPEPGHSVTGVVLSDGETFEWDGAVDALVYHDVPEAQTLARTQDGDVVAFAHPLGQGGVVALGTPAAWAAKSEAGVQVFQKVVQYAASQNGGELQRMNTVSIERGPWTAAWVVDAPEQFTGAFVDVFDPALPVVVDPVYPPGASALLKRIEPEPARPSILFATHRLVFAESREQELVFVMEGPSETLAAARVASPDGKNRIAESSARNAEGADVPVLHKYDPDSRSSLVQFPYHPQGVAVRLRWE